MDLSIQKQNFTHPFSLIAPAQASAPAVVAKPVQEIGDQFSPSSTTSQTTSQTVTPDSFSHAVLAPATQETVAITPALQAQPITPAEVEGWLLAGQTPAKSELTSVAPPRARTLEEMLAETVAQLSTPKPSAPVDKVASVAPLPSTQPASLSKRNQHPGIELHNHLLGIVNTNYFIQNAGDGSPRNLLRHIDKMFQEDPGLQQEAPQLWRLLQKSDVTKLPMAVARKTVEKLLTATRDTPFDGAYTPRDELVKRHLAIAPQEMEGLLSQLGAGEAGVAAQVIVAFSHDGGTRDEALKAIAEATTTELMERGGLSKSQASQLNALKVTKRYEIFTADTVRALAKDGVQYSEQSISVKKLLTQLTPEMMARVSQRVEREGIHSDLRYLAMVNTSHLSEDYLQQANFNTGMPVVFEQEGLNITPEQHQKLMSAFQFPGVTQSETLKRIANASPEQLQELGLSAEQARIVTSELPPELKSGLKTLLQRGDVMGIDIAAPEKESFTSRGMKNFDELYDLLKGAAKERGRELALRPHVGEGYPEMPGEREGFRRHKAARNQAGEPTHYSKAADNLETLISHLEERGYSEQKAKEDGVIIRFGHATHATPQQIGRMKLLGVVAEANLTSNVETGALQPIKGGGDFFENHSLLNLLYHEVPTVLNTDAQGVMHTTMQREYQQADRLISLFQKNKLPMKLEDKQVYFKDLSPEAQARFDPARLREWAEKYGDFVQSGDHNDTARRP